MHPREPLKVYKPAKPQVYQCKVISSDTSNMPMDQLIEQALPYASDTKEVDHDYLSTALQLGCAILLLEHNCKRKRPKPAGLMIIEPQAYGITIEKMHLRGAYSCKPVPEQKPMLNAFFQAMDSGYKTSSRYWKPGVIDDRLHQEYFGSWEEDKRPRPVDDYYFLEARAIQPRRDQ